LAVEDCNKSIELEPNNYLAYNSRAFAENSLGRYDAVLKDFSKAISLSPTNEYLYQNRGKFYYKRKKYNDAINDFNKAIELDPKFPTYYREIAICKFAMGDTVAGCKDLETLIKFGSKWASQKVKELCK
jgi:tetratricopeptide (TPR) repeat protein